MSTAQTTVHYLLCHVHVQCYAMLLTLCARRSPARGLAYLVEERFVDGSPRALAHLLLTRRGFSKSAIGAFLGDLQNPLALPTLRYECPESEALRLPSASLWPPLNCAHCTNRSNRIARNALVCRPLGVPFLRPL